MPDNLANMSIRQNYHRDARRRMPQLLFNYDSKTYHMSGKQLKIYGNDTLLNKYNGYKAIMKSISNLPETKKSQIEKYFLEHYT